MTTLTIEQALALASVLNSKPQETPVFLGQEFPVIVCTDKRGVVFGYTDNIKARPITLTKARMCLCWSAKVGGVFGLGEKGPFDASKDGQTTISATLPNLILEGVTAIFSVSADAEKTWNSAPIAGR